MKSNRSRRIAAVIGGGAIIAMVGLTAACGTEEKKAPETSTTPSSTSEVTPTEKSINPTGGNLFTPTVKAPPAPTAIPGDN
jgi:type IV secretory pathway VirB10-like protein